MDDKYTQAREIVEVFDDFLNDKLANRGIELNCSVPVATEDAKKEKSAHVRYLLHDLWS